MLANSKLEAHKRAAMLEVKTNCKIALEPDSDIPLVRTVTAR